MVEISSDAQAVLDKAGEGARDYVLKQGGFGNRLTSGEATRLLDGFQANPQNVYSTTNVANAANNPTPAPDDLLGIRDSINNELNIPGLNQNYQDIFNQLNTLDTNQQNYQNMLENRPESINLVRGRQAESNRQYSAERDALARQAQVAQSALQAAKQEAADRFAIQEANVREMRQLIINNPGAGIEFGDSPETIAKKIDNYNKKTEKEQREQAKNDAFDNLYMTTFGTDRGKLSRREARKKLEKYYGGKHAYEQAMQDLDLASKRKSLSSGKSSKAQPLLKDYKNSTIKNEIDQAFNEQGKTYETWAELAQVMDALGVDINPGSYFDNYVRKQFDLEPI
jgi:hypothetical protein